MSCLPKGPARVRGGRVASTMLEEGKPPGESHSGPPRVMRGGGVLDILEEGRKVGGESAIIMYGVGGDGENVGRWLEEVGGGVCGISKREVLMPAIWPCIKRTAASQPSV